MRVPFTIQKAVNEAIAHAQAYPDQEVCGLIIGGRLIKGINIANSGYVVDRRGKARERSLQTDFELDPDTFNLWSTATTGGGRPVIYHSHVGKTNDDFSASDVDSMHATQCPFLLIHTPTRTVRYFDVLEEQPYENRPWHWSYSNCYTLVRDWLKRELNFDLYAPTLESPQAWTNSYWNEMLFHGDRQLTKITRDRALLKRGDVLVMKLGETVNPNHVAVYVSPERNEILHQLVDGQSLIRSLSEAYWKATYQVYRVPSLC